jgi:hypothetical protein
MSFGFGYETNIAGIGGSKNIQDPKPLYSFHNFFL